MDTSKVIEYILPSLEVLAEQQQLRNYCEYTNDER